jgi:hypothetical protein
VIAQHLECDQLAKAPVSSDQRKVDGCHAAFTQACKDSIASLHDVIGSCGWYCLTAGAVGTIVIKPT